MRRWRGVGVGRALPDFQGALRPRHRPAGLDHDRAARHRGAAHFLLRIHRLLRVPLQPPDFFQRLLLAVDFALLAARARRPHDARHRRLGAGARRGKLAGTQQRHRQGGEHAAARHEWHRRARAAAGRRGAVAVEKARGAGGGLRRFSGGQRAVVGGFSRCAGPRFYDLRRAQRLPTSRRHRAHAVRRFVWAPVDGERMARRSGGQFFRAARRALAAGRLSAHLRKPRGAGRGAGRPAAAGAGLRRDPAGLDRGRAADSEHHSHRRHVHRHAHRAAFRARRFRSAPVPRDVGLRRKLARRVAADAGAARGAGGALFRHGTGHSAPRTHLESHARRGLQPIFLRLRRGPARGRGAAAVAGPPPRAGARFVGGERARRAAHFHRAALPPRHVAGDEI